MLMRTLALLSLFAGAVAFAPLAHAQDEMEDMADDAEAAVEDTADAAQDAMDAAEDAMDGAEAEDGEDHGGDPEILAMLAEGDAAAGERVFRQCLACHAVDKPQNRVGPTLYGVIGRTAGTVEGFRYSKANAESGVVWTEENLFNYLENPREYIPGTIMAFVGLREAKDRADVIAYIRENGGAATE